MTQVIGNGRKRAVLYARVSTDDQADKGYSLPSQLDLTRKYAERIGYEVVGEYREDFTGAVPIAERPEGRKLAAVLKARQADAIIAYQVDRLSRDNIELLIAVRQWLRAGIEVHTCDIGRIEDENNIILLVKGWQGHDERAKIRERTMRGKFAKAKSGRVVGCRPPYGYQHIRDANGKAVTLVVDEETGRVVRLIYHWYVYGDESGNPLSAMAIAKRLSQTGVPTPGERQKGYGFRKRASGMWHPVAVLDILSHEVYSGVWRFGGCATRASRRRPVEEQIAVSVPAIVDRKTWEAAKVQRKRNKVMARRNSRGGYLLRGLIRCWCASAMCGVTHKRTYGTYAFYVCNWRANHHSKLEKRLCQDKAVRADAIEADVWDEIKGLFSDLDRLWDDLKRAQQMELDTQDPRRDELQAVEGLIEQADHEISEIAAALPKAKGRVGETLQAKADEVNARYDALTKRRSELQAELGALRLTEDALSEILQYARDVRVGVQNADYDTKRRILETLDVKIKVKDGRYFIKCILGETEGKIRDTVRGAIVQGSS